MLCICINEAKQLIQSDMNNLNKLIDVIKSNVRKDVGHVQTNAKGVKYQYVTYILATPFNWVIKMFEKGSIRSLW